MELITFNDLEKIISAQSRLFWANFAPVKL